MLSLFLGAILLTMVIGLYVTTVLNGTKNANYSRLRTDMQAILSIMKTDIRRAGYGGENFLVKDDEGKNISVKITSLYGKHCIIYSYDHNLDQQLNSNDKMGFCYDQALKTVQFVSNVGGNKTWNEIWSCVTDGGTWDACMFAGNWVNISDPNFISITALTFKQSISSSTTETTATTATLRNITIHITGVLAANHDYTYSANSTILVRNAELK